MTTPTDPDAITIDAFPQTISLAGIVGCDPLTRAIVDALAAGHELPDEFLILDTYHDIGEPVSASRCERIRREVRETMEFFGLPMPTTHTMLDKGANP